MYSDNQKSPRPLLEIDYSDQQKSRYTATSSRFPYRSFSYKAAQVRIFHRDRSGALQKRKSWVPEARLFFAMVIAENLLASHRGEFAAKSRESSKPSVLPEIIVLFLDDHSGANY